METFDRDQEYILEKSGIKDKVTRVKKHVKRNPRSSEKFVQKYLDQLSPSLYEKIINLYSIDFQIFNYPLPKQSKQIDE